MELENLIKEMGYCFRDLTYHSSGEYSCRLGFEVMKILGGHNEFWGDTPLEAVQKANDRLKELDLLDKS